jgi:DNA-binding PadR family transcriptional regulator
VPSAVVTSLAISALALLVERPMHPYEMYQVLMSRGEGRVVKVRPGSLYHTVYRLERHGLVRAVATERAGNRPERTVFEVTEAGEKALTERVTEMLTTPVNEFPIFPLAIGEAHNLPRTTVIALLRQRLTCLEADLTELASDIREMEERQVERMFWLEMSYTHELRMAEVAWLRRLLADLDAHVIPWPESGRSLNLVLEK